MKQIIASLFFDVLSYTIGNIIFVYLNLIIIAARVYKLRLAEANFLSCFNNFIFLEGSRGDLDRGVPHLAVVFLWNHRVRIYIEVSIALPEPLPNLC